MIPRTHSSKTVKNSSITQQRKNSLTSLHYGRQDSALKLKKNSKNKSSSRNSHHSLKINQNKAKKQNVQIKLKINQLSQGIKKNKEDICRLVRQATLSKVNKNECEGNCNRHLQEQLVKMRRMRLNLQAEKQSAQKWLKEKEMQYYHIWELFKEAKK